MAITNMQGVQPRNIEEIAARNEEKLTQLGPVIERVNNEKLEVAIDRAFGIMRADRPASPGARRGAEAGGHIKIEFVSILTQMQRMVGLGQIERGFVGFEVGWMESLATAGMSAPGGAAPQDRRRGGRDGGDRRILGARA
jgi:hypothetical protein